MKRIIGYILVLGICFVLVRACVRVIAYREIGRETATEYERIVKAPQKKGLSFDAVRNSLVLISTDRGVGTGFVLEMPDPQAGWKKYIVSVYHLIHRAKRIRLRTMDGTVLVPQRMERAPGLDLVRMTYKDSNYYAPIGSGKDRRPNMIYPRALKMATAEIAIGEPIVVFGNSGGAAAVTELVGQVIGVGPEVLEIDAPVIRGNSGSPIIMSDGKVVGVFSYFTHPPTQDRRVTHGTRFAGTRRFGLRLREDIQWANVRLP